MSEGRVVCRPLLYSQITLDVSCIVIRVEGGVGPGQEEKVFRDCMI